MRLGLRKLGSPSENRNEGEERDFHARMVVRMGKGA